MMSLDVYERLKTDIADLIERNDNLKERIKVLERVRDAAIVYLDDTCVRTEESLIDAVDAARSGET